MISSRRHVPRVRWARLFTALAIGVASVALAQGADDLQGQIQALTKRIQDAMAKGQPPPKELLDELQRLAQKAQDQAGGAKRPPPAEQPTGYVEVPFSGTVTVHREVSHDATIPGNDKGKSTITKQDSATLIVHVHHTEAVKRGNTTSQVAVGVANATVVGSQVVEAQSDGGSFTLDTEYSGTSTKDYGSEPPENQRLVSLLVDPERKVYKLHVAGQHVKLTETTTATAPEHTDTQTTQTSCDVGFQTDAGYCEIRDQPYDPESGSISGSMMVRRYSGFDSRPEIPDGSAAIMAEGDSALGPLRQAAGGAYVFPITYTVSWDLVLRRQDVKVVLEPQPGYDTWMPDLDAGGMSKPMMVKARIVEPADAQGIFEFKLVDVSREPGTCCNSPATSPDTDPDLVLLGGPGPWVDDQGQTAKTTMRMNEAIVAVQARDWGAWGKLTATAKLVAGGREITVPAIYEATGAGHVTIPKDDNDNSIADEWERQKGLDQCQGGDGKDDDPAPRHPGDGLSAYEEYRGFMIQGAYQRLDPGKKDLFIYDPDDLVAGSPLMNRAAGNLQPHLVRAEEMNCGAAGALRRVVNFNHGRYHVVDQHGLWVRADTHPKSTPFDWGLAHGAGEPGPPVTAEPDISVYTDQIATDILDLFTANKPEITFELGKRGIRPDQAWLRGQIYTAIRMVATHECGHGMGITHHRKTLPPGTTEDQVSPAYGWLACVMRYPWEGASNPDLGIKRHNEILGVLCGRLKWADRFCTTMDDCMSQITVSDRGH